MARWLAVIWASFPSAGIKGWLLWLLRPKFLVNVIGIMFDDERRVLLFRHSYERGLCWGLPSGSVEWKETLEEAVCREVQEESGLIVRVISLVGAYRERRIPMVRIAFRCEVVGGSFRPSAEVLEHRYFALSELGGVLVATQIGAVQDAEIAGFRLGG